MRRSACVAAVGTALALFGCSWFTDFKDQPKVEPWEAEFTTRRDANGRMVVDTTVAFRGNPQMSVPTTGTAVPGFQVSYQPMPATIDSMSGLANPTRPSPASLDNGRKYFQINCAVCHGANGSGAGAATRYGMPPFPLLTPITRDRTDGYLFGMIRNGRGLMPSYNRIPETDRWDVVNYIRALQSATSGGAAADTSPAGWPGQNGRTVPGPTRVAPTRPPPFAGPAAAAASGDSAHGAPAVHQPDTAHRAGAAPRTRP